MYLVKTGLLTACLALCACKRGPEPEETRAPAPTADALALRPPRDPSLPLAKRLERERKAPIHDEVAARLLALNTDEKLFVRTHQVLAEPLGAEYCELGVSATGVVASLCGFADESAARTGAKRSEAAFDALIPQRELQRSERLLLTLSGPLNAKTRSVREALRRRFHKRDTVAQRAP